MADDDDYEQYFEDIVAKLRAVKDDLPQARTIAEEWAKDRELTFGDCAYIDRQVFGDLYRDRWLPAFDNPFDFDFVVSGDGSVSGQAIHVGVFTFHLIRTYYY